MTTTKPFKTHPFTRACALASFSLTGALATPALAQEAQGDVEELRKQVQELQQRLDSAVGQAPEPDRGDRYLVRDGDGIKIGQRLSPLMASSKPTQYSGPEVMGRAMPTRSGCPGPLRPLRAAERVIEDWFHSP